jgi:hypothetical protein
MLGRCKPRSANCRRPKKRQSGLKRWLRTPDLFHSGSAAQSLPPLWSHRVAGCEALLKSSRLKNKLMASELDFPPSAPGSPESQGKLCHSCVTHSRNQEDTEGNQRKRRPATLSTGGHWRKRQDTRGHDIRPVRDREAPGSNPGPPTIFVVKIRDFRHCLASTGHSRVTISWALRN